MAKSSSSDELCKTARGHLKAGRLDDALSGFTEALQINELDVDVHEGLGTVQFLKKNYEAAVSHFERATRLDPRHGAAWINLGAVYNRMEKYQKAAEVLRRAVQVERKSSAAYYNLGFAYKNLKQWSLAVPAYREAIRLDPNMADAYLNLGNVYTAMKNYAQAATQYKKALELKPDMERAQRGLRQANEQLDASKNASSPFGRLVDESSIRTDAAVETHSVSLSSEQRRQDREFLCDVWARLDSEAVALHESLIGPLHEAVRTLEKMLTQAYDPQSASITKEEAFEQYLAARADFAARVAQLDVSVRHLREHEAQFQ
jgi:tetratricopeptide (TPR) repeat protein